MTVSHIIGYSSLARIQRGDAGGHADWRCGGLGSPQAFSRACYWLSSILFVVSEVKLSEIFVRNLN